MKNKVVFITGAASGIGYGLGVEFLREGCAVAFFDIDQGKVHGVTDQLRREGFECIGLACDVTNEKALTRAIDKTVETYGKIDVLVNNAGMQHVASLEDFPTEKFEQMIRLMLVAPFVATKHLFPVMKKQGQGRIINIASINGLVGFAGKSAYNSAKHGVIGLTKVAALEGAQDGITVNALCPGYVDTPLVRGQMEDLAASRNVPVEDVLEEVLYPLVPQRRLLAVQEVADYALFLASDKAKGVTGQAVVLDGGYTVQ